VLRAKQGISIHLLERKNISTRFLDCHVCAARAKTCQFWAICPTQTNDIVKERNFRMNLKYFDACTLDVRAFHSPTRQLLVATQEDPNHGAA